MVTLREKSFKEVQSGQWSVTNSIQETMVHEIGHYAHRRYGFMDEEALKVLANPWSFNKAQSHGAFDNYRRKYKKNRSKCCCFHTPRSSRLLKKLILALLKVNSYRVNFNGN